jgi:hypothetical protein
MTQPRFAAVRFLSSGRHSGCRCVREGSTVMNQHNNGQNPSQQQREQQQREQQQREQRQRQNQQPGQKPGMPEQKPGQPHHDNDKDKQS